MKELLGQLPFLVFLAFLFAVTCAGCVLIRRQDKDRRSANDPLAIHVGDDFVELPADSSPREIQDILMVLRGHAPETLDGVRDSSRKE